MSKKQNLFIEELKNIGFKQQSSEIFTYNKYREFNLIYHKLTNGFKFNNFVDQITSNPQLDSIGDVRLIIHNTLVHFGIISTTKLSKQERIQKLEEKQEEFAVKFTALEDRLIAISEGQESEVKIKIDHKPSEAIEEIIDNFINSVKESFSNKLDDCSEDKPIESTLKVGDKVRVSNGDIKIGLFREKNSIRKLGKIGTVAVVHDDKIRVEYSNEKSRAYHFFRNELELVHEEKKELKFGGVAEVLVDTRDFPKGTKVVLVYMMNTDTDWKWRCYHEGSNGSYEYYYEDQLKPL